MLAKIISILKECEVEEEDIYNENLIENEILESLQIAEIVMQFEDEFGIEIDGEDIVPNNFTNVRQMEKLIEKYVHKKNENERNVHASKNEIMWDVIARTSENSIQQSGWKSSFTGEFFSEKEMDEFSENVRIKILPYINQESRVVEIGIGSGLIAEKIAPYVKEYIGIDISEETIKKTKEIMCNKHISNVRFMQGEALEIAKMGIQSSDVVIINSVIQYFNDYEEYEEVIRQVTDIIIEGIIFIGDILDKDKKSSFMEELKECNGRGNTNDLWYSRKQIVDLKNDIEEIKNVHISDKKGCTIQNELTKYRFDAIYEIRA